MKRRKYILMGFGLAILIISVAVVFGQTKSQPPPTRPPTPLEARSLIGPKIAELGFGTTPTEQFAQMSASQKVDTYLAKNGIPVNCEQRFNFFKHLKKKIPYDKEPEKRFKETFPQC